MQSSPAVFRVVVGLALAAALVVQTGLAGAQEEQEEKIRETYRARSVTLGVGVSPRPSQLMLRISIDRWTTDEEHNQLITTLVEKGAEDLRNALQKQEVAGVVFPPSGRYIPLRYAREIRVEGKRIIRLATGDTILSYMSPSTISRQVAPGMYGYAYEFTGKYPFSLIVLRLDENNEGEGTLCLAVEMKYDKKKATLRVESLSHDRVRLTGIKKEMPLR